MSAAQTERSESPESHESHESPQAPRPTGPSQPPGSRVPTGVIGMIHLPPLPGAPDWAGDMRAVLDRARVDARALLDAGVDGILVENYGDAPFHKTVGPETVAAMTAAVATVVDTVRAADPDAAATAADPDVDPNAANLNTAPPAANPDVSPPVGINVLRNDPVAALSIAAATGAAFIRVNVHTGGMHTDQGWIEGRAAETLRFRERIAPGVAILADVMVKHATPPPGLTLEAAAKDAAHRGKADALIVSGPATGAATVLEHVERVTASAPGVPVLVGSGVTAETVAVTLDAAAGVIVGSALMEGGRAGAAVDPEGARRLVAAGGG